VNPSANLLWASGIMGTPTIALIEVCYIMLLLIDCLQIAEKSSEGQYRRGLTGVIRLLKLMKQNASWQLCVSLCKVLIGLHDSIHSAFSLRMDSIFVGVVKAAMAGNPKPF
jgi:hypothetical protein